MLNNDGTVNTTEAEAIAILEDARLIECPNCGARKYRPCTTPTENSRVTVRWLHDSRVKAATENYYKARESYYRE